MTRFVLLATLAAALGVTAAHADVKVEVDHNDAAHATPEFRFKAVPPPSKGDAATNATFTLVDGHRDDNGGDLDALHDGQMPAEADDPGTNFFFAEGTDGGRIGIDLASAIDVRQVNTYSWHTDSRAPQVYTLYGADGTAAGFNPAPTRGTAPTTCGWKRVADVDTRPKGGGTANVGGQYGVSIADPAGPLGHYRYLLLDVSRTEADDGDGNTFFSEVNVIDAHELMGRPAGPAARPGVRLVPIEGGKYSVTIDTSETPDLTDWASTQLVPMVVEWYPKLVAMLPSQGYAPPKHFSITFRKDKPGVADTLLTRVNCAAGFFRQTLKTQAKGAILHEMVHVVQDYWLAGKTNPHPNPEPGWLTEGIADYVRWYKYEPASHGADVSRRNLAKVKYDDAYRPTANFLNWCVQKHGGPSLVVKLNAAMRQGTYTPDLWKQLTGQSVEDLGAAWKTDLAKTAQ